jgi:hypothetical protein
MAVVLYGVLNAAAYACLLPLWEGFDEGYHYGYVQLFSTTARLQRWGAAHLTEEIWHSYELSPVSHYLQPFTGAPVSFTAHFAMRPRDRALRRERLEALHADEKFRQVRDKPNYEVNQSPLPYVVMAAVDRWLWNLPITSRVLWLRLFCAMASVLMLAHAGSRLARELGLPEPYSSAALFCAFSSQMVIAVVSHLNNDGFALPALCYLLWTAIRAARVSTAGAWLAAGAAAAAALLVKAYFLFVLPLPCALLALACWRRRISLTAALLFPLPLAVLAGPWYARNLMLYHNLTGTVESTTNLTIGRLAAAAVTLPWRESFISAARASLWTGNNSFTTFSARTIDLMLWLLVAGLVLWLGRARRMLAEWAVAAAILLFSAGLVSISLAFYVSSKGAVNTPMPWYPQVLVLPVWLIVFLGLSRSSKLGRAGLIAFPAVWAYVMFATYFVKLLPLYGGLQGRAGLGVLWRWYWRQGASRTELLQTTCLASPFAIWTLILAATALSLGLLACLSKLASRP